VIGLYELLGNPTTQLIEPPWPQVEVDYTEQDPNSYVNLSTILFLLIKTNVAMMLKYWEKKSLILHNSKVLS
jgi:hypothetical protein